MRILGIDLGIATVGWRVIELRGAETISYEKLKELLEDHQDIQTVWDNLA